MNKLQNPHFIDWAITAQCNLSCQHCRGFANKELDTKRARSLINEIALLKPAWILIEGGEPLMREDIFELLDLMRQKNLEIHLISNGMILGDKEVAAFEKLGIKVMISIDGSTPHTYQAVRGGASFQKATCAVRNCVAAGLMEAINFTLLKTNYTEIPGIFELASELGVKKVTIIGLKPCLDYAEKLLTRVEYREAIALACRAAQKTGVEFFFDEPFFWPMVKEMELTVQMPADGNGILAPATAACIFGEYLFIETNGDVKPCSFAPMSLGNVNDRNLGEIWDEVLTSPLLSQLRNPETRTGSCRDCEYLVDCKGCRSRTHVLTGDWLAADPACPLGVTVK